MISPLVNYLITMLPLTLSQYFHHKLDTLLSKFLWKGKKARISLKKLRIDKPLGGVNLADFKLYQIAFLTKQGSYWLAPPAEYIPGWLNVEKALFKNLAPASILTAKMNTAGCSISIFKNTRLDLLKIYKLLTNHIRCSDWESLWHSHLIMYKGKPLHN